MTKYTLALRTLLTREVLRFVRQKNRIIGALGTPLVFWFFIGTGLNKSFQLTPGSSNLGATQMNYLQYFFPGTVILILLFTAIFSTISIIEDRREGFLQAVLVSPIPRAVLVLGNLLGGTILATLQGLLFVVMAPFLGIHLTVINFLLIVAALFIMSFGLTGLGFLLAWNLDSTQGFHAIMNLFLMPLWLLSGALFSIDNVPGWLHKVMVLNPITYSVATLHRGFFPETLQFSSRLPSLSLCFIVTTAFSLFMFALAVKVASVKKKVS